MNLIMYLVFSTLLTFQGNAKVDYVAELEHCEKSEDYCPKFYDVMNLEKDKSVRASAYFGVATMMQAEVYSNPFTKLSYFKKGKKLLEEAIAKSPDDAELRFLRYTVQVEVPGILNYNDAIDEDKAVLDKYIQGHTDELAKRINDFYKQMNN